LPEQVQALQSSKRHGAHGRGKLDPPKLIRSIVDREDDASTADDDNEEYIKLMHQIAVNISRHTN